MIAESRLVHLCDLSATLTLETAPLTPLLSPREKNFFTKSLQRYALSRSGFWKDTSSSSRKKRQVALTAQKGAVMMLNSIHSDQEPSARDFHLLAAVISQSLHTPATLTANQLGGFSRSYDGYCSLFPPEYIGGAYVFRFRQRSRRRFLQPTA